MFIIIDNSDIYSLADIPSTLSKLPNLKDTAIHLSRSGTRIVIGETLHLLSVNIKAFGQTLSFRSRGRIRSRFSSWSYGRIVVRGVYRIVSSGAFGEFEYGRLSVSLRFLQGREICPVSPERIKVP